jgi:hypothetical protein
MAAVADAVKVSTLLVPVAEAGAKAAVTPVGRPLAARAMAPEKPAILVMAMVLLPAAPWTTVRLVGDAESVKLAGALTVIGNGRVCEVVPLVQVMVAFASPTVAVAVAANVAIVLDPVIDAGLKLTLTPDGNPLTAQDIVPVNPPVRAIVIVLVPLVP